MIQKYWCLVRKAYRVPLTHLYKKSGPVFDHNKKVWRNIRRCGGREEGVEEQKKVWRNKRTCSLEAVHSVWIIVYSWRISRLLWNFTIKIFQII
jgi:uncharacterized membrane-anchored protein